MEATIEEGAPATSAFGGAAGAFGAAAQAAGPGTGNPPYVPTKDNEQQANGKRTEMVYHCVVSMPQYRGKSFEELRFEDYRAGNKGRGGQPAMGALGGTSAQERANDDPRAYNPELQAGTFQRASAEKLKTRRIVKARRPAQMAPVAEAPTSTNPFANVSLAAPASTNPFANITLAPPAAAANPFANISLTPFSQPAAATSAFGTAPSAFGQPAQLTSAFSAAPAPAAAPSGLRRARGGARLRRRGARGRWLLRRGRARRASVRARRRVASPFGATGAFGAAAPAPAPTTLLSGAPAAAPAFGVTSGLGSFGAASSSFGAPASAAGGGLFGAASPSLSAAQATYLFGAPSPTPAATSFGAPAAGEYNNGEERRIDTMISSKIDWIERSFIDQTARYHAAGGDLDTLFDAPVLREKVTRLYYAAETNWCSAVDWLLKHGADVHLGRPSKRVNDRTRREDTALHVAAQRNHPKMCKLLLSRGASLDARDDEGRDPEARARLCPLFNPHGHALANSLAAVRAAGGWSLWLNAPRKELLALRHRLSALRERGRWKPSSNVPPLHERLFLKTPDDVFSHVLAFWRSDRDD
ncbi:spectrin binding protein [Aureococcus anophagefferens]|uniref:Spectrin binding protein n=1 Tax=Aureococcus anophagefferens TaxID=44056 RepID=A0ABR1FNS8_AURAN